jgi:hypothetical protein
MKNELEFAGTALATTFTLRALVTLLIDKGILSWEECSEMFDQAQHLIEHQQGVDVPANAEIWQIARSFLDHLAEHPMLSDATGADRN